MQNGWSYIKDYGDFLKKIGNVSNVPENAILVTADVVGLYPNIPHNAGLNALNNMLEAKQRKAVFTEHLFKMAVFVLENKYFEFNGDVKKLQEQQLVQSLHRPTCLYLWMNLQSNFYNPNHCNLWYGLNKSMTFSLFGLIAKVNLKSS